MPSLKSSLVVAQALLDTVVPTHGLPATTIDTSSGRVLDRRPNADELGDFAQYIWMLGELAGEPGLQARAIDWGRTIAAAVDDAGLLDARNLQTAGPRFCSSLAACDALWGLTELTRLTGDDAIRVATDRWMDGLWANAVAHGLPLYGVAVLGPVHVGLPLTTAMLSGYFAESMLERGRSDGNDRFIDRAERILRATVDGGYGRTTPLRRGTSGPTQALLPLIDLTFTARGRSASRVSELVKGDVYLLFALLALARTTGSAWARAVVLERTRWIVQTMRHDDGRFFNRRDPRSGHRTGIRLQHNHSVIELLIDVAHDFDDGHSLEVAMSTARAWMATRGRSGLVPDCDGAPDALLDPQVDLTVNLLKLWRLTGAPEWLERFEELGEAIEARFAQPHGLAWKVDASTGAVLDSRIESKFLGLYLKLPILRELVVVRGRHPLLEHDVRRLGTDR